MKESEIEDKFCEYLDSKGKKYKRQVKCEMGIADVVTNDEIYEIKKEINLYTVRSAVSQLIGYKHFINKEAELYIVGTVHEDAKINSFVEFCSFYNITIIDINDIFENFNEKQNASQKYSVYREIKFEDEEKELSIREWDEKFNEIVLNFSGGDFFIQLLNLHKNPHQTGIPFFLTDLNEIKNLFMVYYQGICQYCNKDELSEEEIINHLKNSSIIENDTDFLNLFYKGI